MEAVKSKKTSRHMIIKLLNIHARAVYLDKRNQKKEQMRKSPWE